MLEYLLMKATHHVPVKECYSLCKEGSEKNTFHVVLDLKGTDISYSVGDCIGILPRNDGLVVNETLKAVGATGEEVILDREGDEWNFREYLTHRATITSISRQLFTYVAKGSDLLAKEKRAELKQYLEGHDVWHFLNEYSTSFTPQELVNLLMPLLPRLYSIASSQKAHPDEVHLAVALVDFVSPYGYPKKGVCSSYLNQLEEGEVAIYHHPHSGFTVPEDLTRDMIMIGPGTGVAPFRAFLQERVTSSASGKNWLFFGERNRQHHFFYEEYLSDLVNRDQLRLECAFSRDQEEKIYVQNKMLEHAEELYQWLENGAYFYVCGDAKKMAKDVEETLQKIFQEQGDLDSNSARERVKALRKEKRYLRDVY